MKEKNISRRSFMKTSTLGAGALGLVSPLSIPTNKEDSIRLPRELIVAGFSSEGLKAETCMQMLELVESRLESLIPMQPDIICLPETFTFFWAVNEKMDAPQQAEFSKKIIARFSAFAKKVNSWMICPVVTNESGKYYNAAVLLDRKGEYAGEYRKIHSTDEEMLTGISPGPIDPPVFETDFGKIGIQICFDVQWNDGWEKLGEKGAEIIFWPSAFAGGFLLNARAWQHKAVIVTSPLRGEAKVCDISGEELSKSGYWQKNWVCTSVNLEKAFIHTWPYIQRFDEIQKKYGRKIKFTYLNNEDITIIESQSPEIFVKDILQEFDIRTHSEHIKRADDLQNKARKYGIESLK